MVEQLSDEYVSQFREYVRKYSCPTLQQLMSDLHEDAVRHIAKLVKWAVTPSQEVDAFWKAAQIRAREQQKAIRKEIQVLTVAASGYKRLLSAEHYAIMLNPLPTNTDELMRMPAIWLNEASRLKEKLHRISPLCRTKRLGDKKNLYLWSVQTFIQHWNDGQRRLSDSELADLVEAGYYALGSSEAEIQVLPPPTVGDLTISR